MSVTDIKMAFDVSAVSDGNPPDIQNNTFKPINQFLIIHLSLFLHLSTQHPTPNKQQH